MMRAITYIDTVKIEVDLNNQSEQNQLQIELIEYIKKLKSVRIKHTDKDIGNGRVYREYQVLFKGKQIAGITTGIYYEGSYRLGNRRKVYYVALKLAGLKRYKELIDKASLHCLLYVCRYLNMRKIPFKLTELDIALDINCSLKHVLALVNRRVPNVKYHEVNESQSNYSTTRYIEKIEAKKVNKAVSRAYVYSKGKKAKLDYSVTRFEIKLQSKFFNCYAIDIQAIKRSVDRYTILYFQDESHVKEYLKQYRDGKLDLKHPKLKHRVHIDIEYVEEFINMLFSINQYSTYDMLMPTRGVDYHILKK